MTVQSMNMVIQFDVINDSNSITMYTGIPDQLL